MGVDLNRIGFGISSGTSRTGFGTIVSYPSGDGGGSEFPPEGFSSLYEGVIYPAAQGGQETEVTELGTFYPYQICDVERWHDGTGGFYTNWDTVSNIQFSNAVFYTAEIETQSPVEMPAPYDGNFYDSEYRQLVYTWDGTGAYTIAGDTWGYFEDGTIVTDLHDEADQVEVPEGSENYYPDGRYDTWEWDGSGNIQALNDQGTYIANGTLITDVNQTVEVPTGSESYYENGKYTRYNWNGSGGYTTLTNQGIFYGNNTFITSGGESAEVPSGSESYYGTGREEVYRWNGSGGFTLTVEGSFYPDETFIYDDSTNAWYWDGTGGYYSEPL